MLSLSHIIVGSSAVYLTDSMYWAFVFGVISHFALDKVPHYWPTNKKEQTLILAVDWIITILVIYYLFSKGRNILGFGALGGFSVDLLLITIGKVWPNKISIWHTKRQTHRQTKSLFYAEVIMVIILLYFVLRTGQ